MGVGALPLHVRCLAKKIFTFAISSPGEFLSQTVAKTLKAMFSRLLRHLAWKRREPILISVLHKFVT